MIVFLARSSLKNLNTIINQTGRSNTSVGEDIASRVFTPLAKKKTGKIPDFKLYASNILGVIKKRNK